MFRTHGLSSLSEYEAWRKAKMRCTNPNDRSYKNYGARGIQMCSQWLHDFQAFIDYIGRKPSQEYWLERIKNDRGYEPGNVCWATRSKNLLNRRKHKAIENFSNEELLQECKRRGLV